MTFNRLLLTALFTPICAFAEPFLAAPEEIVIPPRTPVLTVLEPEANVAGTECNLSFKDRNYPQRIQAQALFEVISEGEVSITSDTSELLMYIQEKMGPQAYEKAAEALINARDEAEGVAKLEEMSGKTARAIVSRTLKLKSAKTGAKMEMTCLFANAQNTSIDDLLLSLFEGGKLKPSENL